MYQTCVCVISFLTLPVYRPIIIISLKITGTRTYINISLDYNIVLYASTSLYIYIYYSVLSYSRSLVDHPLYTVVYVIVIFTGTAVRVPPAPSQCGCHP